MLLCASLSAPESRAAPGALTPVAVDERVPLDHWPFAPHAGVGEPALTPHRLAVRFTAGCASPWPTAPLPGPPQSGPWCVAVTAKGPGGLLVVAKPGERVVVLLPTMIEVAVEGGAYTARRVYPGPPGPALVAAIERWATGDATGEGGR
ncbi:MAG: hypothetical protein R3F65_32410 [bacterium]